MSDTHSPEPSRRQWMGALGRWAVGGLLVITGGVLALRDPKHCTRNHQCRGCAALGGCPLQQAALYRAQESQRHG